MKLQNSFGAITRNLGLPLLVAIGLTGCNTTTDESAEHSHDNGEVHSHDHVEPHTDVEMFKQAFANDGIEIADELVECTLASGTKTECFQLTVELNKNRGHEVGPWCPRNVSEGADSAGIWLDEGQVYDADGNFIKNLATFYKDDEWQLYNPITGDIKVTDSKQACLAAAKPNVEAEYQNYCVECQPEYVETQTLTYLIPAYPKTGADMYQITAASGVGLALNGVKFDASAPVDAILSAHTLAPFDDFGGHVNPHVGYHYHAVTDKTTKSLGVANDHATLLGYAADGFTLWSHTDTKGSEVSGLDQCNGHSTQALGYHYHAGAAGSNKILGCFTSEPGCSVEAGETECKADMRGNKGAPPVDENGNPLPKPESNQ